MLVCTNWWKLIGGFSISTKLAEANRWIYPISIFILFVLFDNECWYVLIGGNKSADFPFPRNWRKLIGGCAEYGHYLVETNRRIFSSPPLNLNVHLGYIFLKKWKSSELRQQVETSSQVTRFSVQDERNLPRPIIVNVHRYE